ncbi:lipase/acyltransferase domain-containing protein [Brevibacillus sp. H7]|uniref:lipase/acyltransferase domain-containing protein n=1 Tax=Brevibacillus sp. H7 TaxID=3349138 RepID=UPI00381A188A
MWNTVKRTANLLLLLVLLITSLGSTGWAKQTKPFVEELVNQTSSDGQSTLEQQANAFAKRIPDGKKPKESDAEAAPATFEVEPNDTVKKADWLFAWKDAYGKIGKNGDVDYWKIKAPGSGSLKIWLGQIPSGQNYDLYVFDQEERELGRSDHNGSVDERVEGIGTEKNTWYYVMVRGKGDAFDKRNYYRLKAEFLSPHTEMKPDGYEPNNQIQDSQTIENHRVIEANAHALSDVDFYRIDVSLASTIDLSLANIPEGMDMDLYLYDKQQKQVAKSEKARNAAEQIIYNGDPGTYYIKVAPSKRSVLTAHTYKLNVHAYTIPVILIPGIGGSRLAVKENGQVSEVWLGGNLALDMLEARHQRVLALRPKTPGSIQVVPKTEGIEVFPDQTDDGFRGIEYLTSNELLRQMAEQYYSMSQHLQQIGYEKQKTLFAVVYDWRYSNSDNTKILKDKMNEALEKSRAKQVQLVAHSMGGLLVKETLLSNPSYQSKTKRIIYMGTPFLGSPLSYQAIKFGYNFSIPFFTESGQAIAEYSPAVYELLPSKKYVEIQPFLRFFSKGDSRPFSYEEFLTDDRVRLEYQPLVRLSAKQHGKWDSKKINPPQYIVVGQGQTTLLGYEFNHSLQLLIPFYDQAGGDGTVPFISANYSQSDVKKKYYVNEGHSRLMRNPHVIQQVSHLLLGMEDVQTGISATPQKSHSYTYYMIYREDGELPDITVTKDGKPIQLLKENKEELDGLRVEYHGSVIVVHVTDDQKIRFSAVERSSIGRKSKIIVQKFSSDFSEKNGPTELHSY